MRDTHAALGRAGSPLGNRLFALHFANKFSSVEARQPIDISSQFHSTPEVQCQNG